MTYSGSHRAARKEQTREKEAGRGQQEGPGRPEKNLGVYAKSNVGFHKGLWQSTDVHF